MSLLVTQSRPGVFNALDEVLILDHCSESQFVLFHPSHNYLRFLNSLPVLGKRERGKLTFPHTNADGHGKRLWLPKSDDHTSALTHAW